MYQQTPGFTKIEEAWHVCKWPTSQTEYVYLI